MVKISSGMTLISVIIIIFIVGCSPGIDPSRPDPLLITMDTTRKDHIGAYGNPWVNTPNLDRVARDNMQFLNCISTSNGTNPSHSSMLTSLYCKNHGIFDNSHELPPELIQFPEIYQEKGYKTSAAVSAIHLNHDVAGFGKGFTRFVPCQGNEQIGDATVDSFLDKKSGVNAFASPFMAWLHLFDPHMLYTPPEPYNELFYSGDPVTHEPDTVTGIFISPPLREWVSGWVGDAKDLSYLQRLYGGEVAYLDYCLGRIFNQLHEENRWDQLIMAITSDHGESLEEHDIYFNHYSLYDTNIGVPLIFKAQGALGHRAIRSEYVSTLDIAPTLLKQCGLEIPASFQGVPIDLLNTSDPEPPERYLFCEETFKYGIVIMDKNLKYYENRRDRQTFLFDLETDPGELKDIRKDEPEITARLQMQLDKFEGSDHQRQILKPVKKDISEALKALGYIE